MGQNAEEAEPDGVAYTATITGDFGNRIRSLIDESSALLTERDRLPGSEAALRRRLADDLDRIARILRSEGYYNYKIDHQVDDRQQPIDVRISVERGPAFRLTEYRAFWRVPESAHISRNVGLRLGERARAARRCRRRRADRCGCSSRLSRCRSLFPSTG